MGLLLLAPARVLPPSDAGSYLDLALRWVHIASGITWIGLLYFFNLVSAPGLAQLDGPTRAKLIPAMLPETFAWFRGTALGTVAAGGAYWILLLNREPPGQPGFYTGITVALWLMELVLVWIVLYLLLYVPAISKRSELYVFLAVLIVGGFGHHFANHHVFPGMSHRTIAIGVGGGMGLILLFNVWGIVWPAQKRLITWTKANPEAPPPPELAAQLRRAFLASRASFWLSFPLLFFMAAASHFPIFVGG